MANDDFLYIYKKRLNKFGNTYAERIQGKREKNFEHYLNKTVYLVSFELDGEEQYGSLEKYRQDETQTLSYLLTRIDIKIPSGTVIETINLKGETDVWMIYWLENMVASGYNRYICLHMTHKLSWKDRNGNVQTSWAYMYGQEDNMLKDEIRSRSREQVLYSENLKLSFFILPTNETIRKETYLTVGEGALKEAYVVTGYDIQSTPGVEYVSIDPQYIRDETPTPTKEGQEDSNDFFWLEGGGD